LSVDIYSCETVLRMCTDLMKRNLFAHDHIVGKEF